MNQKHLTQEQRYHIYQCLKQGITQSFITDNIGVNKSTVSRELSRNTGKRNYRYKPMGLLVKDNPCQSIKNGVAILKQLSIASYACNGVLNKYQDI